MLSAQDRTPYAWLMDAITMRGIPAKKLPYIILKKENKNGL
jgi:hypothetical protein